MTQDEMERAITVEKIDLKFVTVNGMPKFMVGWFYLKDPARAVDKFFASETDAKFFRSALINARVNDIASGWREESK